MTQKIKCKYCGKPKDPLEFQIAATVGTKVYRRLKCNDCYRETKNKLRQKIREWVRAYKATHPCPCGFSDVRALVFHHPNPDKEFNLGEAVMMSFKKVKIEAAKCKVLCLNCHTILHSEH